MEFMATAASTSDPMCDEYHVDSKYMVFDFHCEWQSPARGVIMCD
jgi:hypothetical protein